MNEKAIKKLKNRFLVMAMVSFAAVMVFMGGLIYLISMEVINSDISETLDKIIANDGYLPKTTETGQKDTKEDLSESSARKDIVQAMRSLFAQRHMVNSPEFAHSARYFAVLYDKNGDTSAIRLGHISSVDEDVAVKYADRLIKQGDDFGSFGNYYFKIKEKTDGSKIVVIMDCTNQVAMINMVLKVFLGLLFIGLLAAFIVMKIASGRMVKPAVENAEMQKRFITNASHELKTPLSVIRANTELLEVMNGENEWTESTMRQVVRLQSLINNLVMVTRSEEQSDASELSDIDVSRVAADTAETFRPVAEQDGKKLNVEAGEGLTHRADEAEIRQLLSLLIDNAIKYCDDGGEIGVAISQKGRRLTMEVTNDYAEGEGVDYNKFFDRFYREDQSHNIDKGGFGIGLSIAQNLVERYKGKIQASWKDGRIAFTCTLN
ncbi:MAG: HAMP domain-containing sensor histidine kinase [Eubacteriales bacterium]|nr:HAMP domain-containing sensor histidine kinase [Eubacteriales bacterium]